MYENQQLVGIARCHSYDIQEVDTAIKKSVEETGGIEQFIKPGSKVLVKPNLLMGQAPEKVVTTNPSVVRSVVKLLTSIDCKVIIGDSPGAGLIYSKNNLEKVYRSTGLLDLAEELGVPLNYDVSYKEVSCPDSRTMKTKNFPG